MHICGRCGYSTNHKGHFIDHLQKKTLCPPRIADIPIISIDQLEKKKFKCDCCDKIFSSQLKVKKHKEIMNELRNMNPNVNKIKLNYFGNENYDYITYDTIKSNMSSGINCLKKIINEIYFNKNHPENSNIRLKNVREKLVEIYTKNGWVVESMNKAFDKIIDTAKFCIMINWINVDLDEVNQYRYSIHNFDYYLEETRCDEGFREFQDKFKDEFINLQIYIRNKLITLRNI